jgi:pimeloyl-ACP methyl ester carboxylesterase
MAQDLMELLATEGLPAAHLLGHSMGGKAAMYLALHHPERVSSLVVVDIAPRAYIGGHEPLLEALHQVDLSVSRREEVETQLSRAIPDSMVRQFLLKSLARDELGRFFWRWNLPVLLRDYPQVGQAISGPPYQGPALFLRGERSAYIQPSDEAAISVLFPKARIETISGAGHWVHVENPPAVIAKLREFWEKV